MERSGVSMTVATNKERIDRLERAFEKLSGIVVGNGVRGMDEVIREIEKRVGVVESDMREVKSMVKKMVGYSGVTYDSSTHPGRRESDKPQRK